MTKHILIALLFTTASALTGAADQAWPPVPSDSPLAQSGAAPAAPSAEAPTEPAGEGAMPPRYGEPPVVFIGEQAPGEVRVSELVGTPVAGHGGEYIAEIADLIVDDNHQLTTVVLSSGGMFGIGGHEVALPHTRITITSVPDGIRVYAPLSADDLADAPAFRARGDSDLLSQDNGLETTVEKLSAAEPAAGE